MPQDGFRGTLFDEAALIICHGVSYGFLYEYHEVGHGTRYHMRCLMGYEYSMVPHGV